VLTFILCVSKRTGEKEVNFLPKINTSYKYVRWTIARSISYRKKTFLNLIFRSFFSGPKRDRLRKYLRCQLVHTLRNRRLKPSNSARRRSTGNFLCKFNSLPVFGCRWNRVPIRRRRLPQRASSLSIATTSTTTQKTFLARGLL
jgi:hypothetical protein